MKLSSTISFACFRLLGVEVFCFPENTVILDYPELNGKLTDGRSTHFVGYKIKLKTTLGSGLFCRCFPVSAFTYIEKIIYNYIGFFVILLNLTYCGKCFRTIFVTILYIESDAKLIILISHSQIKYLRGLIDIKDIRVTISQKYLCDFWFTNQKLLMLSMLLIQCYDIPSMSMN